VLKDWNKNVLGNVHKVVEDQKRGLASIQLGIVHFSPSVIFSIF